MSELESLLHRPRPSAWDLFKRSPCLFAAEKLYARHRLYLKTPPSLSSDAGAAAAQSRRHLDGGEDEDPISVVCISDTHNNNARCDPLPPGDVLIHAGDLTQSGSLTELQAAADWLHAQPHRHKIVAAGNHDVLLDPARSDEDGNDISHRTKGQHCSYLARRREEEEERAKLIDWGDVKYLCDSGTWITLNGRNGYVRLKVWGSPRSPRNGNWGFQYAREDADKVWDRAVPDDVDILVTHGPPRAHLDTAGGLGCEGLLREVWRVRPRLRLHVFGHVHAGHGHEWVQFDAVQRAYERTVTARGGVWNLCRVIWAFGTASLWSCFWSPGVAKCQMVNAAMVGGLRDEVRHRPIKVYI
ncbi:hypothetical protein PG990_010814 [Apiospora arundinis]